MKCAGHSTAASTSTVLIEAAAAPSIVPTEDAPTTQTATTTESHLLRSIDPPDVSLKNLLISFTRRQIVSGYTHSGRLDAAKGLFDARSCFAFHERPIGCHGD